MTNARVHRASSLAVLLAVLIGAPGCGKKGPPRAPIRILPPPPGEMRVRQIGPEVILTARLPEPGGEGAALDPQTRVSVLRLPATPTLRPGAVSDRYLTRQFERQATELVTLAGEALRQAAPEGRLLARDTGAVAEVQRGAATGYLYSVSILTGDGRRSELPRPLLIRPAPAPAAPRDPRVETAEGEVRLSWTRGAGGAESVGFNVYRRAAGASRDPDQPLNRAPIAQTAFVDTAFRYGESYVYFVRSAAQVAPPPRESANSPEVRVTPLDRFPPAAPGGLAVAAEGRVIRIYWFPNSEPDLAGYRIYRSEQPSVELQPSGGAPPVRPPWPGRMRIGETGAEASSFTDATAVPAVRYYYAVTAVDDASPPNESPRSEERSEMLAAEPGDGAAAAEPQRSD